MPQQFWHADYAQQLEWLGYEFLRQQEELALDSE
jgi:hypothetical protein